MTASDRLPLPDGQMPDCQSQERPPATVGPAWWRCPQSGDLTVLASPRGDARLYHGRMHHTFPVADAVDRIDGRTTIKLLPGKYYRAVDLVGKRSSADSPITLEGHWEPGRPRPQICGSNAAGSFYPDLPSRDDYAFFKLRDCAHIVIRGLSVESCWPSFVYAENVTGLHVADVHARDGSYLVFARGPETRDIAVTGCRWVQDPTRSMWDAIDWQHTHHGAYAYYNGALLGGVDVIGDVRVENNDVSFAFNGVRLTTSTREPEAIVQRFNRNVRIRANRFSYIRDNVVEPECTCYNWHVCHNEIVNSHAMFSIHDLHGGYFYIYGNKMWFDCRGGSMFQDNRGGKVYKLRHKGPLPDHPIHVFHNSLYIRTFLIKKARARHFWHRNNIVQFCESGGETDCLCRPDRAFFNRFPINGGWDRETVVFDGDASNKPFGTVLQDSYGQERHGVDQHCDLRLAAPQIGNFKPLIGSPVIGAGLVFTLSAGSDLPPDQPAWTNWDGPGRPSIGAVQPGGTVIDLPFYPAGGPA